MPSGRTALTAAQCGGALDNQAAPQVRLGQGFLSLLKPGVALGVWRGVGRFQPRKSHKGIPKEASPPEVAR